jgi:hypothetical protein
MDLESLTAEDWQRIMQCLSQTLTRPDAKGCTLWTGCTTESSGVPQLSYKGMHFSVRQLVRFFAEQHAPDHTPTIWTRCGNSACCTLDHLNTSSNRREPEELDELDWHKFWTRFSECTVQVPDAHGCVRWIGALNGGHPTWHCQNSYRVRSLVHLFTHGAAAEGRLLLTCDSDMCVQPEHLVDSHDNEAMESRKLAWMHANSDVDPATGCILWKGVTSHGYGLTRFMGKDWSVHRLAWKINQGDIAADLVVRHDKGGKRCTSTRCWNVDHLSLGTRQDNANDAVALGTMPRGERHPSATTTEAQALAVKRSKGQGTAAERSKRFGVSLDVVQSIDAGRTWCHLPDAEGKTDDTKAREHCDAARAARRARREQGFTKEEYLAANARIEAKVTIKSDTQCHLLPPSNTGYGSASIGGVMRSAHKIVFELHHNDCKCMKGDDVVRHLCHNKACVNIRHLARGTASDNVLDTIKDNRHAGVKMLQHVEDVRKALAAGTAVQDLAEQYGVSCGCIRAIQAGTTFAWK